MLPRMGCRMAEAILLAFILAAIRMVVVARSIPQCKHCGMIGSWHDGRCRLCSTPLRLR